MKSALTLTQAPMLISIMEMILGRLTIKINIKRLLLVEQQEEAAGDAGGFR